MVGWGRTGLDCIQKHVVTVTPHTLLSTLFSFVLLES
jgi:hypothetical protein